MSVKSKMERFVKIVNAFLEKIFAKRSVFDVWQGSENVSVLGYDFLHYWLSCFWNKYQIDT